MKAYSKDLHQKVLAAALARRGTLPQLASTFGVSRQFISNVLRRHRAGEPAGPKVGHVGEPKIKAEHEQVLRELLAADNDLTLEELRTELAQRGGPTVSIAAMSRTLVRLDLPRKKSRSTPRSVTRPG